MWAVTLLIAFWMQQAPSIEEAIRLLDAGQLTQAQQVLSQLDPNAPEVSHTSGVVYYRLREYAKAIEALSRAVQKEPATAQVTVNRPSSWAGATISQLTCQKRSSGLKRRPPPESGPTKSITCSATRVFNSVSQQRLGLLSRTCLASRQIRPRHP